MDTITTCYRGRQSSFPNMLYVGSMSQNTSFPVQTLRIFMCLFFEGSFKTLIQFGLAQVHRLVGCILMPFGRAGMIMLSCFKTYSITLRPHIFTLILSLLSFDFSRKPILGTPSNCFLELSLAAQPSAMMSMKKVVKMHLA